MALIVDSDATVTLDQLLPAKNAQKAVRTRPPNQMRKLFLKPHAMTERSGSAYVELGNTKVMCMISGPKDVAQRENQGHASNSKDANADGRIVTTVSRSKYAPDDDLAGDSKVKYSLLTRQHEDSATCAERRLADFVTNAVSPAVILTNYRRCVVELDCTVIEDDGGVLCALILCAGAALLDARIDLYDIVTAACVSLDGEGGCLVDVAKGEHDKGKVRSSLTIAQMASIGQITGVYQEGIADATELGLMTETALEMSAQLRSTVKTAMVREIE